MFELRNNDEIWYKSVSMYDWILYGKLYVVEPTEIENQLVIKKFDFESRTYEITNDFTEYEYNGKVYSVADGMFEIEPEPVPDPQPTQSDRIEENQLILMEAMAEQYEESLENRLNDQEVQAIIYETLLEMQEGM